MWDTRLSDIIVYLSTEHYKTAEYLADHLEISVRTVRNRIKEINDILEKYNTSIESKARYGYKLTEESAVVLQEILSDEQKKVNTFEKVPSTQSERIRVIFFFLLNQGDYVKSEYLQEFFSVSKGTLTGILRQLEQIINAYNLHLDRKPNYGIKIDGSEFDIRKCMTEVLLQDSSFSYVNTKKVNQEFQKIAKLILGCMSTYKIRFSEIALEKFIKDIYIQVRRIRKGYYVGVLLQEIPKAGQEWNFVQKLQKSIEKEYTISLPEEETSYIYLHLAGKCTVTNEQVNYVIRNDIDSLVEEMIEEIYHQIGVDFRNNLTLHMALNQHMVPFDIRITYSIPYTNPMLKEIKENYPFGFFVAKQAQIVLERHYNKEISEDEISFFAPLFTLAWEQKNRAERHKLNILIVCNSGRGLAKILEYKFLHIFSEYLEHVYTSDLLGLDNFDFRKIDYVFTTVPIYQRISVPIQEIGVFLKDEDIGIVKGIFQKENKNYIKKMYDRKHFYNNIEGKTREEILQTMCLSVCKEFPELAGLLESVMERENLCATDFGNYVAIPHPCTMITKETYIFIGILPTPIIWSRYPVQLVMLMLVGEMQESEQQDFYEVITRLVSDRSSIETIIKERDYHAFMRELEKQLNK